MRVLSEQLLQFAFVSFYPKITHPRPPLAAFVSPPLAGCHKCAIRANNAFSTSLSQRNDASSSTLLSPSLAILLFLFLLHPHPPTILHTKENAILCISSASPSVHYLTSCICIFLSLCSRICIFTLCLSLYLCISDSAWASRTSSVSAHEVSIPS